MSSLYDPWQVDSVDCLKSICHKKIEMVIKLQLQLKSSTPTHCDHLKMTVRELV